MTRQLTLLMTFKNAAEANTNISPKVIKETLTRDEITTAMDAIKTNNAFYITSGYLVLKVKADIVDTKT